MEKTAYKIMEFFAGAALIIAAIIVVLNILLGKLFGSPLKGTYEMVGLCCCVMASMAIPMATLTGGHVSVDIVVRMLKPRGRMIFEYIAKIFDALVGVMMVYACSRFAIKMLATRETTATLSLPVWPFRFVWMLGCVLIVVFSIYNIVKIPAKYRGGVQSSADAEIEQARLEAEEIYGLKHDDGGGK
jgi:TRAP-type C4-dicarboxylate transport system permease small subunit